MQTIEEHKSFGGTQGVYRHVSAATGAEMAVAVYVPPQAKAGPVPVLTYLSGLTCTWENVVTKGGFQAHAARHGVIVVAPDTSPRGTDHPGEHDSYDYGSGAGSTSTRPWSPGPEATRSEEHTSELQSLMRISYAVFCLKKKKTTAHTNY